MSNAVGTQANREEEIAFLIMEDVLGVKIQLADAGGGNKKPDGSWIIPSERQRRGIVEITSPPDQKLMKQWAKAKREGLQQKEGGSIPLYLNQLDKFCAELLSEDWAQQNIVKLLDEPADERHLFLFGRSYRVQSYFDRLSDEYDTGPIEFIDDLVLPEGIDSVWFQGRAARCRERIMRIWVARFQTGSGWHRYTVDIDECNLPPPSPSIGADKFPAIVRKLSAR